MNDIIPTIYKVTMRFIKSTDSHLKKGRDEYISNANAKLMTDESRKIKDVWSGKNGNDVAKQE
jgi:hypothetical protein